MGVNYTDDISGKPLDRDLAYAFEFTKFESDSKLIKSKKFYVGIDSVKSMIGDKDLQWKTITKGPDGKWA